MRKALENVLVAARAASEGSLRLSNELHFRCGRRVVGGDIGHVPCHHNHSVIYIALHTSGTFEDSED